MNEYWEKLEVRRGLDTAQPVFDAIGRDGWIAGSYAAFMACINDQPILPNDIDIFAKTSKGAARIANRLIKRLKIDPVFGVDVNATAWSLRPDGCMPVQVVKPNPNWKSFPDDILNSFDLDISRALLVSPTTVLADYHVGWHEGKIIRVNDPLRTLKRVIKYAARGVAFDDHELLKVFQAWDQVSAERKEHMIQQAEPQEMPDYSWYIDNDDYFEGE